MKPVSFYLVTDTHYFDNILGAEGKAFEKNMATEQYFVKESSAIVKSTFARISEDKETDIVIIPGDLTKNGEKESHKGFIKELYKLKENGKKIFVITAGHDYNDSAYVLKGDGRVPVEGTDFDDLCEMYRDFGYGDAISIDEITHSYMAQITEGVRMLAICCDSKGQPKGAMDERHMSWAKDQIDRAKKDNCSVFAICHYPVIPSVPVFDLVGDAKIKDWKKVASFLADNGVELILTGHMHIQSINEFYSEKGNRLIDVCTSCLVGSPAKYRKITIDEKSLLKVETIDVEDFGWDLNGLTAQEYFHNHFAEAIVNRVRGAFNGGDGIVKHLKAFVRKRFEKITVGTIKRLFFIKKDKSFDKKKLTSLIGEVGIGIFLGDGPHTEGTPVYNFISGILNRFSFILKKVEPKLTKEGNEVDLRSMLFNTIGNNKGFSDNNAEFTLK
ncbi:MAG: metallophosphoesterase [Clostridia bacterium]|nr:metallophosphoesterase [Clostridia bacterium]